MNPLSLEGIKLLRKKYHLNQKELAERAGVSQSLIAKIESGTVDPSFTKTQQIFAALDALREKKELKARDIMHQKVVFAHPSDRVRDLIKKMRSRGISQMPVLEKEKVVGIITEGAIIQKMAESPEKIPALRAQEVLEDTPPIVALNTGQRTILELLREYPIVLVAEKGELKGIISKTDMLGRME